MELSTFAKRILYGRTLAEKLITPPGGIEGLTDNECGDPRPWQTPGRPPELTIAARKQRVSFPHPDNLGDPEMAVRALHTFANHELMALEMMAWALLAYPDAPKAFRAGICRLLIDEQRHLRLYMERIEEFGARFGDLPVNDHFLRCAPALTTPLKWVCAMNLTFEQANLDHAPFFAEKFERVRDERTAKILKTIFEDEIHHVGFGARWLFRHCGADGDSFETYVANLSFHNKPARGRGESFDPQARRRAGLDDAFIQGMMSSS